MKDSFSRRMWNAVAFIESGREHFRQLDAAFENGDGDAMAAALYTLASKRPKLAANLPGYVTRPDSESDAGRMIGKPMKDIRRAADAMRFMSEQQLERYLQSLADKKANRVAEYQPSLFSELGVQHG